MNNFVVKEVRADRIYKKIMLAKQEKKDDIYRYDFMKQFEGKWEKYHCPLKAKQPGGHDVVMASGMLGYLSPKKIDENCRLYIEKLSNDTFWDKCRESIQ